ncbi:MAG: sensor histidine kinase [Prolixibacteraceae bacterium]|nr:sensor histidine kinase [Prolixibacteraceae bacterium]
MLIKVALILSVILQFAAAIISISLVRRTKTNIAWWLISLGFVFMAVRRIFEMNIFFYPENQPVNNLFNSWIGVLISLIMLLSLIFIRRIFNIQKKYDELRKQSESKVLSAIVKTEETERMRFAKELHDGLGPLLSSVKMSVSTIKKQLGETADQKVIDNVDKLVDESIVTIKEISDNISPHILNNFGLYKALHSFVTKIQNSNQAKIIINSNLEEKRFAYNIEVVFYRVVCELITNTLKHASAKKITIDLFDDNKELILEYFDDGIGFNPEKTMASTRGMGLANMRSRLKSLNGSFQVFSRKGQGVCFTVKVKY